MPLEKFARRARARAIGSSGLVCLELINARAQARATHLADCISFRSGAAKNSNEEIGGKRDCAKMDAGKKLIRKEGAKRVSR